MENYLNKWPKYPFFILNLNFFFTVVFCVGGKKVENTEQACTIFLLQKRGELCEQTNKI